MSSQDDKRAEMVKSIARAVMSVYADRPVAAVIIWKAQGDPEVHLASNVIDPPTLENLLQEALNQATQKAPGTSVETRDS